MLSAAASEQPPEFPIRFSEPGDDGCTLWRGTVAGDAGAVHPLVERALALWDDGAADQGDAMERFLAVYTDPVVVNGVSVPLTDLLARASGMAAAFADRRTTVHDVVEGDGFLAFAFEIRARHVGPWVGLAATIAPSGREVTLRGMDIFHVADDGRVARLWAVNDQSDLLADRLQDEPGQSSPR